MRLLSDRDRGKDLKAPGWASHVRLVAVMKLEPPSHAQGDANSWAGGLGSRGAGEPGDQGAGGLGAGGPGSSGPPSAGLLPSHFVARLGRAKRGACHHGDLDGAVLLIGDQVQLLF